MTEPTTADIQRLLISLCCGLVLLAPLAWTLDATSYGGVAVGVVGTALTALAFGLLPRGSLPDALLTSALTAICLVPLTLAALLVFGARPDGTTSALILGLPAVALAALLTARIAAGLHPGAWREDVVPVAVLAGVSLALCLGALAPNVHGRVAEAHARAHLETALEGAGVLPLMPDIDGFSATEEPRADLASVTYGIELVADGEDADDASSIRIEAGPLLDEEGREAESALCESEGRTCTQVRNDFLVIEGADEDTRVVATVGRTRLEATLYQREGGLPDPEEVGQALRDAELVGWDEVLRLIHDDY